MANSSFFDTSAAMRFEPIYLDTRGKEQRIYKDEEVLLLPEIAPAHPHYKEWHVRKHSSSLLIRYLKTKPTGQRILEVGCGNGWLSARLARIPDAEVTGSDINQAELDQARSVFNAANL